MSCLVCTKNLADDATVTSSITMDATLTLAQLKRAFMAGLARTDDGLSPSTNWILHVDFGAPKTIDVIALYGINTIGGDYSVSVSGGTATEDDTSYGSIGSLSSGNDSNVLNNEFVFVLEAPVSVRYLKITAGWETAAGVTYYDARRLWIGPALRLRTASIESAFEVVDRGSITRSRGERVFSTPRKPHKLHTYAMRGMTQEQAIGYDDGAGPANLQKVLGDIGLSGEIAVYPTTADQHRIHRLGTYGHLESSARIRPQGRQLYAAELVVRQAPA